MKLSIHAWVLLVLMTILSAAVWAAEPAATSQRELLDANWRFHLGDIPQADQVITGRFNDAAWQAVDVPHDYVLAGKYEQKNDRGHGYLPYEVGWYRRHLTVPASAHGKVLRLDFDGVFRDSEVWLNGQSLGKHPSGYTPFSFDITTIAKIGGENVITVRVDPTKPEGWWYEGGGIYRHVWLTTLSPVHLAHWGTAVVSNVQQDGSATVAITTKVQNSSAEASDFKIVSEIVGPDGKSLQTMDVTSRAPAGGDASMAQKTLVEKPELWDIESPNLYQLRTTVYQGDQVVDQAVTNFGIRTLRFDPEKGFFLNGKHIEINGTANHQDFSGVGIAVPDSLQAWRVEQLKKAGCNAWRTAHNPPSDALLDACDRLGMLVMDENRHLGDAYSHHSGTGTKATDLSDLATMIQRDRNHPSIIMWSMCNEEGLQGKSEGAEIFKAMVKVVHQYDTSRPITSAMNAGWLSPTSDADVEDIIGVNYNTNRYDAIHKKHPDKMMFGSEDTNEKTTRGEYADVKETGMRSCYNLSEKDWLTVADRPFMAGSFTWTGFDYKGEPNPYGWPDVSNNTGLVDNCGFPKDKFYYFQSCWTTQPMVHVVPMTWNWPGKDGQPIRVMAFSNAKRVELFLNGKSLGSQDMKHDAHVEWQVPYAPGQLIAKAFNDDQQVAENKVETTGSAKKIVLGASRTKLTADGEDAVVVTASVVDEQGRVVPNDDKRVVFALTGKGKILGVGNGNPADHDTDKANNRKSFHGLCIAVVEAGKATGPLKVTATSPGLDGGTIEFEVNAK